MSKGLSLVAVLVLVTSGAAEAQPIFKEGGCRTRIGRAAKRARCVACVRQGKVFHKRGVKAGVCLVRGAGAAIVAADASRTAADCRVIARTPKRARCLECVRAGGVFQRQGAKAGFCRAGASGKAVAAVAADTIHTIAGCRARVLRAPKRARCMACIRKGKVFQKGGPRAGFCRAKGTAPVVATAAAAVDVVRTVAGCNSRVVRPPKRARCLACVNSGKFFQKHGAGVGACREAPGIKIRAVAGCRTRIARQPKKDRCTACIRRGGIFHRGGAGAGFCTR